MKQGYIQSINSVSEFQMIVKGMNEVGVESENIIINPSFQNFIKTVENGDCIVVYNLDFFNSLSELKEITVELAQRGVNVESLSDAWYNVSAEMVSVLVGVNGLGKRLRASSTRKGLIKAKAEGKKLGRPVGSTKMDGKIVAIKKLRHESKLSIAQACEIVKCNPRTYYRYTNKGQ